MVEGLYSRRRHLGKQGEFEEFKREYGKKAKEVKQQKKKMTKRYSQENYQGVLQLKCYGGGQIESTKDKEKEGKLEHSSG